MNKWISDCKVGDKVIISNDIYTIVKANKKQFVCLKDGTENNFERIMKNGGKVVGRYSNCWASVLETTPEVFLAKVQAKADAKKAEADARAAAWNDKVTMVRERNTNIIITDEGMGGLKKAVMIDSKEQPMIVYFSVREEQIWRNYSQPPVMGVRLDCSTWRKDYSEFGFSHTQQSGATIEDALIELVAGHYWN